MKYKERKAEQRKHRTVHVRRFGAGVCPAQCMATNLPQQIETKKSSVSGNYRMVVIPIFYLHTSTWEQLYWLHFKADRRINVSLPFPRSLWKFAASQTLCFVNSVTLCSVPSFCSKRKAGCLTNSSSFDLAILQVPYVIPKNPDKTTPAAVLHWENVTGRQHNSLLEFPLKLAGAFSLTSLERKPLQIMPTSHQSAAQKYFRLEFIKAIHKI